MSNSLQKYGTAIIGVLVTVFLSFASDFLLHLPREFTWLTFFLGSITTVAVTLLEHRLIDANTTELNKKLEIYNIHESIKDPELHQLADIAIAECIQKLKDYQSGIITSPVDGQSAAMERLPHCKKSFETTFWVVNKQSLYRIQDTSSGRSYFQANVDAVKRGVDITRIFLLGKAQFVDANHNFFDSKAIKIIQQQQASGIKVRICWLEELERLDSFSELFHDFGILDNTEVIALRHGVGDIRHGTLIIKNIDQVRHYRRIYDRLWRLCRPIDEFLLEYPLAVPPISES